MGRGRGRGRFSREGPCLRADLGGLEVAERKNKWYFLLLWGEERKWEGGGEERRHWAGSGQPGIHWKAANGQPTATWCCLQGPCPVPRPGPARGHPAVVLSPSRHTHTMLAPHFSQVWSLGGAAGALDVGREYWGLSELGTKAGVPPGRARDRHTGAQPPQRWPSSVYSCHRGSSQATPRLVTEGPLLLGTLRSQRAWVTARKEY